MNRFSRQIATVAGMGLFISLGSCTNLDVPDYNANTLSTLQSGASAAALSAAAVGILATSRDVNNSFLSSYIQSVGTQGREGILLDPSNGQDVIQALQVPMGTIEPGNAGWPQDYKLIKQANVLIHALDSTASITAQQKEALRGFAMTMKGVAFLRIENAYGAAGAPVATDVAADAPAPAIVDNTVTNSPSTLKTYIAALLDSAQTHLLAGGTTFPISSMPGFTGFDTPPTFIKFNRGLRSRIAVYSGDWAGALTGLTNSFLDTTKAMSLGVFDTYSLNSGDRVNPLYDPTCRQLFSLTITETEAQKQPGGAMDQRVLNKIQDITPKTSDQIPVSSCFKIYNSGAASIPILKNEELILLRAEAELQTGDRASALKDVNTIRVNSGKLAPLGGDPGNTGGLAAGQPVDDQLLAEILYNRRYSLLWEQGARWEDARRYNYLATLPTVLNVHVVYQYFPLPTDECVQFSSPPTGCNATPPHVTGVVAGN